MHRQAHRLNRLKHPVTNRMKGVKEIDLPQINETINVQEAQQVSIVNFKFECLTLPDCEQINNHAPTPRFPYASSFCSLRVSVVVASIGLSWALLPNRPPAFALSLRQPSLPLSSLCLNQPGLCRAAPCGIRALPRRDPSLTSPCWDAATFPAKHCLPWLYYVCLRRSPASRGRQRRRETGSQSQDKEKAGRQRLAKG